MIYEQYICHSTNYLSNKCERKKIFTYRRASPSRTLNYPREIRYESLDDDDFSKFYGQHISSPDNHRTVCCLKLDDLWWTKNSIPVGCMMRMFVASKLSGTATASHSGGLTSEREPMKVRHRKASHFTTSGCSTSPWWSLEALLNGKSKRCSSLIPR